MTMKFDKNIEYRNALYGGAVKVDEGTPEWQIRFFGVTLPSFLAMIAVILFLCCCTRPDSIICRICEPTVKEKPGGGSARRRSARSARLSARMSARSQAIPDEEAGIVDIPDVDATEDDEEMELTEEAVTPETDEGLDPENPEKSPDPENPEKDLENDDMDGTAESNENDTEEPENAEDENNDSDMD